MNPTKQFKQKHYDVANPIGIAWSKEVMLFFGWECIDDKEHKLKHDLVFKRGDKSAWIDAEVRTDGKYNFDAIGRSWDTINIPWRKTNKPHEMAHFMFTFNKEGTEFWKTDMEYAKKFPTEVYDCSKDGETWEDTKHVVKLKKPFTKKYIITRNKNNQIEEITKIMG